MATHSLNHYPARSELPRWILTGVISGAVSVLLFHQGAAALLYSWGVVPNPPYVLEPTQPFGVPVLWSMAFWGAVWGAVLAASLGRLDGAALVFASAAFGAVLPTLVAWLVVAPLKDRPVVLAVALIVNAAWGLGTGLGLALFGRGNHARETRSPPRARESARR
jgi:hypothetical protein